MPFGLVKVKSISAPLPLCGDARIPAPFADQSLLTCPGRSDTGIGCSPCRETPVARHQSMRFATECCLEMLPSRSR